MKIYLVPTDFSSASENCLKLAIQLSRKTDAAIYLLHFCETRNDFEEAEKKSELSGYS